MRMSNLLFGEMFHIHLDIASNFIIIFFFLFLLLNRDHPLGRFPMALWATNVILSAVLTGQWHRLQLLLPTHLPETACPLLHHPRLLWTLLIDSPVCHHRVHGEECCRTRGKGIALTAAPPPFSLLSIL